MATPPDGLPSWSAPSVVARSGLEIPATTGRHRGSGRGARRATARTSHRLDGMPVVPGPATAFLLLMGSWRRWWREASARRARAVAIRRAGPYRPGLRWTILCLACAGGTAVGSFVVLAGPVAALPGFGLEIPSAAPTGQQPTWLGPAGPTTPLQVPAGDSTVALTTPSDEVTAAGTAEPSPVSDMSELQLPGAGASTAAQPDAAPPDAAAPAAAAVPEAAAAAAPVVEPGTPVGSAPRQATSAPVPAPSAAPSTAPSPTPRTTTTIAPTSTTTTPTKTTTPPRTTPPTPTTTIPPATTAPTTTTTPPTTGSLPTTAAGTSSTVVGPATCRPLRGAQRATCLRKFGLPPTFPFP